MILKYGSYAHDQNEAAVVIQKRAVYGPRGNREYTRETWNIRGMLHAASQAALTTAIGSLQTAYSVNGYDLALYLDDGTTLTSHYLLSSQTTGGVRITGIDFPEGDGAEYSTFRTYAITAEADFYDSTSALVEYTEAVTYQGTGGPRRIFLETLDGMPQEQIAAQRTTYKARQRGRCVNNFAWANPSPPIWPAAELVDQRQVELELPMARGADQVQFVTTWSYVFESTTPLSGRPRTV